jgi:hypothetical protein
MGAAVWSIVARSIWHAIMYTSSNQSDKRIRRLLASHNLAAELEALRTGTALGDLILSSKVYERIIRHTQREFRR